MPLQPASLVLVSVMNDPRDMEIARVLGWYRIPLRSAPKVVAVDYLAFYQTSRFGDEKWRIQYVAPVRGYELTTRAELLKDELDHPHAQQEYYKIQLGPLERLQRPVLAEKWRRITFLYTLGEHLLQAQRVSDLVVGTEDRRELWRSIRERAQQVQPESSESLPDFDLSPDLLAALLGFSQK